MHAATARPGSSLALLAACGRIDGAPPPGEGALRLRFEDRAEPAAFAREGPAVRDDARRRRRPLGRGPRPAAAGAGRGRQHRHRRQGRRRALRRPRRAAPTSASPTRPPTPSASADARHRSALPRCAASRRLIQPKVDFDSARRPVSAIPMAAAARQARPGVRGMPETPLVRRPLPRRSPSRRSAGRRLRDQGARGAGDRRRHRHGAVRQGRRHADPAGLDVEADDALHALRGDPRRPRHQGHRVPGQPARPVDGRLADVRRGRHQGARSATSSRASSCSPATTPASWWPRASPAARRPSPSR